MWYLTLTLVYLLLQVTPKAAQLPPSVNPVAPGPAQQPQLAAPAAAQHRQQQPTVASATTQQPSAMAPATALQPPAVAPVVIQQPISVMVRLTDPQSTFQDCLQPTNDGIIFALSWGKPRSSSHKQPPKRFMSHGLWPGQFVYHRGPNAAPRFNSMFNCHTMQTQLRETDVFQTPGDQKLQTALNSRWLTVSMTTNYQLWNHEFIKHGTCVSHINYQRCTPTHWSLLDRQRIETLSYFNMVNVFSHQVNVKALFQASGIAPIYTKPYSRTSILQALAAQTQVAVELQCWTNTNTNSQGASTQTSTLKEIRFYYKYGKTASSATHVAYTGVAAPRPGNCGPQIYFTP